MPLAILSLAGCLYQPEQGDPCGPEPVRPGYSVAFEQGVAKLPVEQFVALTSWADSYQEWVGCQVGQGEAEQSRLSLHRHRPGPQYKTATQDVKGSK